MTDQVKGFTGTPPLRYLAELRMRLASQWIGNDRMPIETVAGSPGYASQAALQPRLQVRDRPFTRRRSLFVERADQHDRGHMADQALHAAQFEFHAAARDDRIVGAAWIPGACGYLAQALADLYGLEAADIPRGHVRRREHLMRAAMRKDDRGGGQEVVDIARRVLQEDGAGGA